MKKLIAKKLVLLAAVLLAGVGSASAFEVDGLTYRVIDNDAKTVRVTYKGSESMSNPYTQSTVVIPSTVVFNGNTYSVIEIGDNAFSYASMSSITIPSTVKTLGSNVFSDCKNLRSIDLSTIETFGNAVLNGCTALTSAKLPENIETIPQNIFSGCTSMTSYTFSDKIRSIGSGAFFNTGLTSVNFDNIYDIGEYAFSGTNLQTVILPEYLYNVGNGAFSNCNELKTVTLLGSMYNGGGIFFSCNNINTIICLSHWHYEMGFSDDVKEMAAVYVPESQVSSWSSEGFLNVKAANIGNVGHHVIDVYDDGRAGKGGYVSINGKTADTMHGQAFFADDGTDLVISFSPNVEWGVVLDKAFIDGVDVTSSLVDSKYTISNLSGNHTIQATWKEGSSSSMCKVYFDQGNLDCGQILINGTEWYGDVKEYALNTDVTIRLKPNDGYGIGFVYVGNGEHLGDKLIDNGDGSYSYTFTLKADTGIGFHFDKKWTLKAIFNDGGTVSVTGENLTSGVPKVIVGGQAEVSIYPNPDYEITSVLLNGVERLTEPTTTFGITPYAYEGDNQTLEITFRKIGGSVTPTDYEYVDLGLPSGTKWATMNVGATSLSDEGDFFAWGETTTKAEYTSSNYIFGSGSSMTKYNNSDNLTILQPEDDAATVKWGEGWRTPTIDDWRELNNRCTKTYTSVNGVGGYLFTGTNGNTIFLPGQQENLWGNVWGSYWSSSVNASDKQYAWNIDFDGGGFYIDEYNDRSMKGNIRPVREGNLVIPTEQCATPTITYADGQLQFECETEGAECHYKITSSDISEGIGNLVPLTATYHISVYATKSGYLDSDTATYQVEWTKQAGIRGDTNGDGVVDVEDVVETVNIILEQ